MSSNESLRAKPAKRAILDPSDDNVVFTQSNITRLPVAAEYPRGNTVKNGVLARRWLELAPVTTINPAADQAEPEPAKPNKKNGAVKKLSSRKASAKKKSGKVKPAVDTAKTPGTARGIETMFRSSYRTQLDLTALAALKANIMISLNGFILSVLTLSGPFVLVAEPLFTVPIAIFLATCLVSIIFAVLAAQPRRMKSRPTSEDFSSDRANVLVFEEFSVLSEEEHLQAMMGLLHDNTRIYENMTRQIYMLGTTANRKFRMLRVSYSAFLAGLTISTLLLLGIGFFHNTPDLASIFSLMSVRPAG